MLNDIAQALEDAKSPYIVDGVQGKLVSWLVESDAQNGQDKIQGWMAEGYDKQAPWLAKIDAS